jgi:hypothetical protein
MMDELATALEACLALPDTPEWLDPQQLAHARELLDTLKNSPTEAVLGQIDAFAESARQQAQRRLAELHHERDTLAGLTRKNREVVERLQEKLAADQRQSQDTWKSFDIARKLIVREGGALLGNLDDGHIEKLVSGNLKELLGSPTTPALFQAMHTLIVQSAVLLGDVERLDRQIRALVETVYDRFNDLHGFTRPPPAPPGLDGYRQALQQLDQKTSAFCRNPINLMTDKNSLAKKFGLEVATPLRGMFAQLRTEMECWLQDSIAPLQEQIQAQKIVLEKRETDINMIRDQIFILAAREEETAIALDRLRQQEAAIAALRENVRGPDRP